jgi:hypothetical protein
MPWVKIDDHYDEHPKFASVGPLGVALWLAGLAYCNRNLTDGFIPWSVAPTLVAWAFSGPRDGADGESYRVRWTIGINSGAHGEDVTSEYVIGLLVDAGLWDEGDDGYVVHDFDQYQPTRAEVQAERARKQAAGRAGGLASGRARGRADGRA